MMFGDFSREQLQRMVSFGFELEDARFQLDNLLKNKYSLHGLDYDKEVNIDLKEFESDFNRLISGEPIAYIIGKAAFYQEEYFVNKDTLIPRPDTELLVETALRYAGCIDFPMGDIIKLQPRISVQKNKQIVFADFCTGSGCVGISIANALINKGYAIKGYLIDVSDKALSVCKINVQEVFKSGGNGELSVAECDIFDEEKLLNTINEPLDFIVSNPPYITTKEMEELDRSVIDFEPHLALEAEENGLIFYRQLCKIGKHLLREDAPLIVEHGYLQGELVREIFAKNELKNVVTLKDFGGNERVTYAE